ncbi:MAG: Holliday junction branch migration protein RuvA [Acidobacteria bacterium]|nr:Holliday junction branch migration protein RuvA [Acidobacteriota bacterium]MCW5948823.1 Holliday junction branch migration protein RuvA [Pyrinomonadaceae bacterium]
MIAYLSGKLLEKSPGIAVIDVGGVGYEIHIPLSTFYDLGEVGSETALRIYTHVREDAIQLFGFTSAADRELFVKLIGVQGIGPKLGITILSGMTGEEFIAAVRTGNAARIKAVPGVGQKTAERTIIELRDKIGEMSAAAVSDPAGRDGSGSSGSVYEDALSALLNLGYQKAAAENALKDAAKGSDASSVQKLLRDALQRLAR